MKKLIREKIREMLIESNVYYSLTGSDIEVLNDLTSYISELKLPFNGDNYINIIDVVISGDKIIKYSDEYNTLNKLFFFVEDSYYRNKRLSKRHPDVDIEAEQEHIQKQIQLLNRILKTIT